MSDPAPWQDSAACNGVEIEVFFPEGRGRSPYRNARTYCDVCPVEDECLEDALVHEWGTPITVRHGMFGGLTPEERRQIEELRRTELVGVGA